MGKIKEPYVCPSDFAGSLDNSFRRWLQNPEKILTPHIRKGMTVLDLGCGPGVFTTEIAKLVGESGRVIAADLQDGMLEIVKAKLKGTESEQRVQLHKCDTNFIGLSEKTDFILAFWMVHEVPDHMRLFGELKTILKPGGQLYIIEPRWHVTGKAFDTMSGFLLSSGFEIMARPRVFFSRSLILTYKWDELFTS
jgi:ubiquinone/menaquinone biosynthesis C-methylase UbiE